MTERPSRQHDKDIDKGASEPKVQDISKLVDQSTITLQDLDQRMQHMRASLAHLIAQSNLLQGSGLPPSGFEQQQLGLAPWSLAAQNPWAHLAAPDPYAATRQAPPSLGSPYGNAFGNAFGNGFGAGNGPSYGQSPQLSPTGSPAFQPGGLGETRTTRDLKDIPPQTRQPASDVVDDGNNFQIRLEMPGVKKEDMDIMVTDRAVLVTALARLDLEDGVVVVQERGPIVYRRTIQLPGEIKTSECQAKLKDGVLRLAIPKKNPTDSPRHLEIAYG